MQWIDHLNQHSVTHPSQSLSDGPLSELFAPGVKYLHFTRENSLHPLSHAWTTMAEDWWTDGHTETCHPGHGVALKLFTETKSTYPKLLIAEDALQFIRKGTDVIDWWSWKHSDRMDAFSHAYHFCVICHLHFNKWKEQWHMGFDKELITVW